MKETILKGAIMGTLGGSVVEDKGEISDGYHTFNELYEHRFFLFRALCHMDFLKSWKSKIQSDGNMYPGWFIAGIGVEHGKQITYHLPLRLWNEFKIRELEIAPEFDGHSSSDVVSRLREMY